MSEPCVEVRLFGSLHTLARERGEHTRITVDVPTHGIAARDLATQMRLPLEMIEGVFCNRVVRPLDWTIRPGDRVAFVPRGTPGPHRVFLGLYAAGEQSHAPEDAR